MTYHLLGLGQETVDPVTRCQGKATGYTLPAGLFHAEGLERCVNLEEPATSLELKKLVGDLTHKTLLDHPTWTAADEKVLREWAGDTPRRLSQTPTSWAYPNDYGFLDLLQHCLSPSGQNLCADAYPQLSALRQWRHMTHGSELVVQPPHFGQPAVPQPPPADDDDPDPGGGGALSPPVVEAGLSSWLWLGGTTAVVWWLWGLARARGRR